MSEESNTIPNSQNRLSSVAYIIGGMSFIPMLGVPFGMISIVWGLVTSKAGGKRLAIVGLGGICFTLMLYGSLFYFGFVQRGGIYDDLRRRLAQTTLNSLVPNVEFYKMLHGQYPASLKELGESLPKNTNVFVFDPSRSVLTSNYFFYERVGNDHYYLRSVGPDDQPFTADDIVPELTPSEAGKTGLLLERKAEVPIP